MSESVPRVLANRYEIGELIGRGGMAEVHIGKDTRLSRTVAIKILRSDLARDATFQARFKREAQSAAALNHPAIVAVYDSGEDVVTDPATGAEHHVPFIVMEYVEGHGAGEPRDGAALPIDEAIDITAGVLAALEYSHAASIVHRDIKPANVMLTPTGSVKVMDFGIARAMADNAATMTATQAVVGTAQYLSPEQARGEVVDTRSDLYSTGCLLYELLTGRPPFVGDSAVSVAYQHVTAEPEPPSAIAPDVPEALDRIVMKALSKDRDQRYATAAEFRADLEAAANGLAVAAPALGARTTVLAGAAAAGAAGAATQVLGGPPPPTTRREAQAVAEEDEEEERSNRALIWILSILGVLLVGGIIWVLLNREPAEEPIVQVAVPDLTGMDQTEANAALTAEGLLLNIGEPVADPEIPEGEAVSWDPPTGEMVDPDTAVTVVFSSGPDAIAIPDVVGETRADAQRILEDAGFTNFTFEIEDLAEVPQDNEVDSTSPPAGTQVPPDEQITIVVGSGNVEVQDYTGFSVEDAVAALNELGLQVDTTSQEDPGPEGVVLSQSRTGLIPINTRITLVYSIPAPTPEPTTPEPTPTPSESPTDLAPSPSPSP